MNLKEEVSLLKVILKKMLNESTFREQIEKKVSKKAFFHGGQDVKSKLEKILSEFQDYQLSLYQYSCRATKAKYRCGT